MNIKVCDLCKSKEPNKRFKVKMSRKGCYQSTGHGFRWVDIWQPYEKIDICGECGERLLNLEYRGPNGLGRLPVKEMTGNDI